MEFSRAFLLFCLLVPLARGQEATRVYEKVFPAPSEAVALEMERGLLEVVNRPAGSEVKISVRFALQDGEKRRSASPDEAEIRERLERLERVANRAFDNLEPRFKADARRVGLVLRDSRWVVYDRDPALQVVISVRVEMPAGISLRMRTVSAGVSVADFEGSVDLEGDSGSYFFKRVRGDVRAKTRGGGITLSEVLGRADLKTVNGNIFVGLLGGPSRLETSNGSVEVQTFRDRLEVEGKDSSILVGLSSPLAPGLDVRTSAGFVTLNIDRTLPFTIDVSTLLLGKVRSRGLEPAVRRGGFNESALVADFNGGGERVVVRTAGATVELIGREPLDG